jgi:DNA repair exonuclease SbcCD ATPase subunit
MKKLGWVVLAALSYTSWAASIGCGGVSKQELDTVKAELLANDEKMKSSLKSELTGIDQKYVTVQQLQMKVEKQLEEMTKLKAELTELAKSLDARANVATGNTLKAMQFEEKLMSERLAELRNLIEELKKK